MLTLYKLFICIVYVEIRDSKSKSIIYLIASFGKYGTILFYFLLIFYCLLKNCCSSSLSDADAAISVAVSAATDDDTSSVVTCPFPIELLFFTKPIMPIITEKQITLPKKISPVFHIVPLSLIQNSIASRTIWTPYTFCCTIATL